VRELFFETETILPASRAEVFDFFSKAENLGRITPPWLHFRIRSPLPIAMREGTLIDYTIRLHGLPMRWRTRITLWDPPFRFVDEQIKGPYRQWMHEHSFYEIAERQTKMRDAVRYALPFFPLGMAAWPFVRAEIAGVFAYRRQSIAQIFPG